MKDVNVEMEEFQNFTVMMSILLNLTEITDLYTYMNKFYSM